MSSTFDGLYIAKSGVQAARVNLNVTGQNITNASTDGYTRQRVDQSAVPATSIDMLYAQTGAISGEGTQTTGVSQLRNAFLDGQYRTQNAECGSTSTQLSALQDVEDALNETTTDGISSAYSDLVEQLEGLTSTGSSTATESTVKEAASLLATKLNTASSQLDTIWNQQYDYLDSYGADKVNTLLKNIAGLSDQIKNADLAGTPALELMDERNKDIDELSEYVSVKVVETPTDVGSGKTIDTMSIELADEKGNALTDANGNAYKLTDGNQYAAFSVSSDQLEEDGSSVPSYQSNPVVHVRLSGLTKDGTDFSVSSSAVSTDASGNLAATDSTYSITVGSTNASVEITTDATDTMKSLVSKAQTAIDGAFSAGKVTVGLSSDGKHLTFTSDDGSDISISHASGDDLLGLSAAAVSTADSGIKNADLQGGSLSSYLALLNESGEYDTAAAGDTTTTERGIGYYEDMLNTIAQKLADVMNADNSTNDAGDNKPLFTDSNGETVDGSGNSTITAANIRVSPDWTTGYLTLSKDTANAGDDSSGSNSNITSMISDLTTSQETLQTPNGVKLFTGTMQEAVSNISLTLGQDISSINSQDTSNSTMLSNIDTRRQSLSSVDINEEAINLVVYNQALTASARFMTTVDECLETIISNMGLAGRS